MMRQEKLLRRFEFNSYYFLIQTILGKISTTTITIANDL